MLIKLNKQHVMDYIDTKFPNNGCLMNEHDYERLESLIHKAIAEPGRNRDLPTIMAMGQAMRSRDCNFLECFDKYFSKTNRDN